MLNDPARTQILMILYFRMLLSKLNFSFSS